MKQNLSKVILSFVVLSILGLHIPDADARGRVRKRPRAVQSGA